MGAISTGLRVTGGSSDSVSSSASVFLFLIKVST